jgi:ABC-type Na+ transport system ATPase subunit NatA
MVEQSPYGDPVVEMGLAVEACGVTKWFGGTTALDQVDFTVLPGSVHGLLGPNGAGKTTLLSALFGLVLPDEGTLRLSGRTRAEAGPGWLDGVGGFVESPRFYPYLSGRQNLAVLAGLDGGDAAGLIDGALERVGLADAHRQKVRGYSLGMRQRLGLAAAMLRRPRLLILDEPANGMDHAGASELPPVLGFTSVAVMLSVVSRNSVVGIGGPALIALVLQIVTLISLPAWGQMALLSTPFTAWHGFWVHPAFYGPFLAGLVTCTGWFLICAAVAWLVFRRRTIGAA